MSIDYKRAKASVRAQLAGGERSLHGLAESFPVDCSTAGAYRVLMEMIADGEVVVVRAGVPGRLVYRLVKS